jgi:DnaD/phage-associated family protein
LIVLPALAVKIGLNEAIIVQQMHYWLQKSKHIYDGQAWIYNTHAGWQEQFPFWSINTIRRAIKSLEDAGILIVGNYNKLKIDNTKWYRIDYQVLEGLSRPPAQNGQTECSEWADHLLNMGRPLPETTTETTTENKEQQQRPRKVTLFKAFQENFGRPLNPMEIEKIKAMEVEHNEELVLHALEKAVLNGVRNLNYIDTILNDWHAKSLKTVFEVQEHEERRKSKDKPKPCKQVKFEPKEQEKPEFDKFSLIHYS